MPRGAMATCPNTGNGRRVGLLDACDGGHLLGDGFSSLGRVSNAVASKSSCTHGSCVARDRRGDLRPERPQRVSQHEITGGDRLPPA